MGKRTIAVLTTALAVAGAAPVEAQEHREHGPGGWAAAHCSAEAVRARHRFWVDETTLEGLFALASLERECGEAGAASAEPEPELIYDRPWTAFCSEAELRRRHPNADGNLLRYLDGECHDSLQAAANAAQVLRPCRYSSVSECNPDGGCTARPTVPVPDERWLEIPPLDVELWGAGLFARSGYGPWPTVRRCDTQGCDRIEVDARQSGAYFVLEQRDGPWFVKIEAPTIRAARPTASRFVEVATQLLGTLVYYGACSEAHVQLETR